MTGKPQTLQSKVVFQSRVFQVVSESIQLPNGPTIDRDTVKHPGAAAVLPFETPETVLLVKQYRPAVGDWILEVPAGTLTGPEEDPRGAAIRETEEETGFRPRRCELVVSYFPTPGFVSERLHLFVAWDLERTAAKLDHDEFLEVVRMPWADLRDRVKRGDIIDGKTVSLVSHLSAFPPANWWA